MHSLHPGMQGWRTHFVSTAMWLAVHFFSSFSFSPNKINFQPKVMAYRYYFRSPGCKHFRQSCTSSSTSSQRSLTKAACSSKAACFYPMHLGQSQSIWLFSAAGVEMLSKKKKKIRIITSYTGKRRHGEVCLC